RINLESQFPKQLASYENEDLERIVTYEKIKRVVWDYGSKKSSGPDGFTFEFYRRYWKLIDQDVDAKVIKDFRPISLIGSVYKSVVKILANRLSLVISDLISHVQSAFVANRQILDGPFILMSLFLGLNSRRSKL
nr:RNA-directed DNA polymerase, eukaryota, reverse transcriptase zinc-binding domain protein [Tanacetum cinerariifolium]